MAPLLIANPGDLSGDEHLYARRSRTSSSAGVEVIDLRVPSMARQAVQRRAARERMLVAGELRELGERRLDRLSEARRAAERLERLRRDELEQQRGRPGGKAAKWTVRIPWSRRSSIASAAVAS